MALRAYLKPNQSVEANRMWSQFMVIEKYFALDASEYKSF